MGPQEIAMAPFTLCLPFVAFAAPQVYTLQEPGQAPRGGARIGIELATDSEGNATLEVSSVVPGSPGERAGLQYGDVLLSLDGERLEDFDGLKQRLAGHRPGDSVDLQFRRELSVTLDQRGAKPDKRGPRLGVNLAEQGDSEWADWVITHVEDGWPAAAAGLQEGDRLESVAGAPMDSFEDLLELLAPIAPGDSLSVVIDRTVTIELGGATMAAPEGEAAPAEGLEWRRLLPEFPPSGGGQLEPSQPRGWRYHLVPPGETPLVPPTPRAPAPGQPNERSETSERGGTSRGLLRSELDGLREELRGLHQELRTLHEELQRLREQLEQVRRLR